jgi:hypothetical protein
MKKTTILLLLTIASFANAQKLVPIKKEIPGTGLSILLPDTSFKYGEEKIAKNFTSENLSAGIGLSTEMTDGPLTFEEITKAFLSDFSQPSIKIELDTAVTVAGMQARVFKVIIHTDTTATNSTKTGSINIAWMAFYNFNNKPLNLVGMYQNQDDAKMHDPFLKSFLSLTKNNDKSVNELFKKSFSITNDYAPLKFVNHNLDGFFLNMTGTWETEPKDSSYCLVVPYKTSIDTRQEFLDNYGSNRLSIHASGGNSIEGMHWRGTYSNSSKTVVYWQDAVETLDKKRIVYLYIKCDEHGYFEVWGEAYGPNKKDLIPVFKKIAESLKRN